MAQKTVETQSLKLAAEGLEKYILEVQESIKQMKNAAIDCSDNLDHDVYTTRAINDLEECVVELNKGLEEAKNLREKIINRYNAIINT